MEQMERVPLSCETDKNKYPVSDYCHNIVFPSLLSISVHGDGASAFLDPQSRYLSSLRMVAVVYIEAR